MTKTKLTNKLGLEALRKLKCQNFLFLALAGAINAVGVTMFLAPVNLYDSGISGTSMLLWQVTPEQFNLSLFLVLLNDLRAQPASVHHWYHLPASLWR